MGEQSNEAIGGKLIKKFVLGVDLDGVVSDFVADVRTHAAEWLGKPIEQLTAEPDYEFTQWGINEAPGGYPELHKFAIVHRNMFINSKVMPGAPQALRNLSAKNIYIRIITSRICIKWNHAEIVKQTVDWLEKHGIPYWDLCFVKDKLAVNADLYIDDSPSNILRLRKLGRNVAIFKTSVNKGVEGLGADNWENMQKLVLAEKQKYGESL